MIIWDGFINEYLKIKFDIHKIKWIEYYCFQELRDIINDPPPGCSAGPENDSDCKLWQIHRNIDISAFLIYFEEVTLLYFKCV